MKQSAGSSASDCSREGAEASVSSLLSSFYDVGQQNDATDGSKAYSASDQSQDSWDEALLSGAIFGNEDFDVDQCLTTALKKYSMVELIALLRRLEREVRQFTAGKQILIYDNYECLFSSLDTVHEINADLTVLQKQLYTLKSSQIKASSVDISSRYGFREKLRGITELNRVLNIFQALACIATCLHNATKEPTTGDESKEHFFKLLELLGRVYVILNMVRERSGPKTANIKLFQTFNQKIRILIPNVVSGIVRHVKNEFMSQNVLVDICCNLAVTHITATQLWEIYWVNKSLGFKSRLHDLIDVAGDSSVTLHSLSNHVINFLMYVLEAVYSDGYFKLARFIESNTDGVPEEDGENPRKRDMACIFCCADDCDIVFEYHGDGTNGNVEEGHIGDKTGETPVYRHYWLANKSSKPCVCIKENIAEQFVVCYVQLAFATLQPRLMDRSKHITWNEIIFVLTCILDKVKSIPKGEVMAKLLADISFGWILLTVLLYLQKQFYPVYDAVASAILSASESRKDDNPFEDVYAKVERTLKDVADVMRFVDDLGDAMHLSLRPLFTSFLAFYIGSLKSVFNAQFKVLVHASDASQEDDYSLGSLAWLLSLRGSKELNRQELMGERIKESRANYRHAEANKSILGNAFDDDSVESELLVLRLGLSVEHYLEWKMRKDAKELPPSGNNMTAALTHLVTLMVPFNLIFNRINTLAGQHCSGVSSMLTSGALEMLLPSVPISPMNVFDTEINTCAYLSGLMDYAIGQNCLEGLLRDHHIHLTAILHAAYRFAKEHSTWGLVPIIKAVPCDVKRSGRYSLMEGCALFDMHHITLRVLSHVMIGCMRRANTLIRYAMESLEYGDVTAEDAVKDLTGVLYDAIEFLNATADPTLSGEITYIQVAELNRKLKYMSSKSDVDAYNVIRELSFVPSKDMCLKLFTIHVAQSIARNSRLHVITKETLRGLTSRIEKQLVMAFKKSSDAEQMKRVFTQLANTDTA
ncbi:Vacuolar sorting-associated, putative [Babesia ovata]|uniref:Vacuolar protein sorting-associated protein 51 homolog n=1 Tax=Babesia ovata TaxID=189622 RepID=A0A2H6KHG8_9APIC|nr:Vacuolar sorting-associated, putative [Babesia ovata]GBE62434.1 Vacuolar sorting-associated, putative [Babesia ovata]